MIEDPAGPTMIWGRPVYRNRLTMREIAASAAAHHGLSVEDLMGRSRVRTVVWPRQEAMATMYATGSFSTTQIGRFFDRDHTTVIFAIRRAQERYASFDAKHGRAA